jgi:hypothetical protein
MYKCVGCGNIFEEGEQAVWEETHGLDSPPYEKFCCCPSCGGEFEEAKHCVVCGGCFLEDELNDGICNECLYELEEEYRHDFNKCYEISENEKVKVELNFFLSCMFTEKQIEEILMKNLKEANSLVSIDCTAFLEADRIWLQERIAEEVKKK